jgi:hypothetical protein
MRITLTKKESDSISSIIWCKILEARELSEEEIKIMGILYDKIDEQKYRKISDKKIKSAQKATQSRIDNAKKKIENAVNMLRMRNIDVTTYTVSLESGCSFNTCKKYKKYWS